jgi:hypothetical protein
MLEFKRAMKCLIIWRIILNFIFPMKNYFSPQNLPMERASGKATNDIDIVLYNAVSREKRVLINGRPTRPR